MRGGALKHQIDIQTRTENGRDALNQPVYAWSTWREPYSEIETRSGAEHFDPTTKQRFSQSQYRFRCRYLEVEGLDTANMRIVYDGKTYDIRNVLPDEQRHDWCVIVATLQGVSV